jgi:hypothetical protein
MGKAGTTPITADTVVPYTKGIKYGQLCNVRRHFDLEIRQGQLLAYNGAWDRKAVVSHVHYCGSYEKHGHTQHVFTVGIQQLGNFYATGKFKTSKPPLRELQVETSDGHTGSWHLNRWVPVQPFTPPTTKGQLHMASGNQFSHQDYQIPVVADNGPTPTQMAAMAKSQSAIIKTKSKPGPIAEAVLADFLIPTGQEFN